MIFEKALYWIVLAWLCLESGQFVETRVPWGTDILFWPLWIALYSIVILGLKMLDLHYTVKHQSALDHKPTSNQDN